MCDTIHLILTYVGTTLLVACLASCGHADAQNADLGKDANEDAIVVTTDPQNVVSSELMGRWKYNLELSERLDAPKKSVAVYFLFEQDEEAEKRVTDAMKRRLIALRNAKDEDSIHLLVEIQRAFKTVFMAGSITQTEGAITVKADFALCSMYGNPRLLVYYPKRDDFEEANLMLARDESGNGDMLFMGGNSNNRSFNVFVRAE